MLASIAVLQRMIHNSAFIPGLSMYIKRSVKDILHILEQGLDLFVRE